MSPVQTVIVWLLLILACLLVWGLFAHTVVEAVTR